jgi:hypothetical protein
MVVLSKVVFLADSFSTSEPGRAFHFRQHFSSFDSDG